MVREYSASLPDRYDPYKSVQWDDPPLQKDPSTHIWPMDLGPTKDTQPTYQKTHITQHLSTVKTYFDLCGKATSPSPMPKVELVKQSSGIVQVPSLSRRCKSNLTVDEDDFPLAALKIRHSSKNLWRSIYREEIARRNCMAKQHRTCFQRPWWILILLRWILWPRRRALSSPLLRHEAPFLELPRASPTFGSSSSSGSYQDPQS